MNNFTKVVVLSAASALSFPAVAQTGGIPKIQVGNGAPLSGSNESLLGLSVLTADANRTPISVRLLGSDKLLGLSLRPADSKSKILYLEVAPSLDTKANLTLPK
jgi:hypothetical protein